jgi:hypothetical protein
MKKLLRVQCLELQSVLFVFISDFLLLLTVCTLGLWVVLQGGAR